MQPHSLQQLPSKEEKENGREARKELLKLLNFDGLIHEYLAEGNGFRRRGNWQKQAKKKQQSYRDMSKVKLEACDLQYGRKLKRQKSEWDKNLRPTIKNQQKKEKKPLASSKTITNFGAICQLINSKPVIESRKLCQTISKINVHREKNNKRNDSSETGRKLKDRYVMEKVIGLGLSGVVWKGKDILSNRLVAIKIISLENVQYEFIKKFQHPGIISYYNSFVEKGKRYLILQYFPMNLAQAIRKKKLMEYEVKHLFKGIAECIFYLHSLSYAHRDIKLENILVNEELDEIRFIDFGLCVELGGKKYEPQFCGTSGYMAPEVVNKEGKQPKKSDIWSLGMVLYSMFVGRTPAQPNNNSQIFAKGRSRINFPNQISSGLKNLLQWMLEKNPSQRPTINDVLQHEWLSS